MIGPINELLAKHRDEIPDWEMESQREQLIQQQLPEVIKSKLLFMDVQRTVPPDKIASIEEKVRKAYHEDKVEELKKSMGATSLADLDAKLREMGSSLAKQEQNFFENVVCRDWLRTNMKYRQEVTPDEMLAEYRRRQAEYFQPAKVRWERLMVRLDQYPDRDAAFAAIAALGNEVLHGAPLAEVAKRSSQCPNASLGGQYDWTRQGSLAAKKIDQVLFSIPVDHLSRIIEEDDQLSIVRVIERKDAG
ncbi:MAG TPA: peptidylprolyl isomerase, partial [Pirellulaceae bacterium]